MSELFAERLSRFTPDAGKLDRDALLFAAGRASARPGRRWPALAALAASQLLTLVFLWPHTPPTVPTVPPTPPVAVKPPPSPSPAPADSGSWAANWRLRNEPDYLPPPSVSDSLVPDDPPLRASSPPAALLN